MERIGVRKLSRLGNEIHLTAAMEAVRSWPGHHQWGTVFVLLLRGCVDDWVEGDRFRAPAAVTRSASIRSVAASLHRPFTTIHRHALGMLARGALVDVGGRIAVSPDPAFAPTVIRAMTLAHDSFVRLAEDLSRGGMAFPAPTRGAAPDLRRRTLLAALDVWLIPFEYAPEPVADWTSKLVWIVIVIANVRHVTVDPDLSERYAVAPTPDDVRRPIPIAAIIALTGLSYGTAYRHCQALAALNVVRYERGGWLLVSSQLEDEKVDQGVHALLAYFRKRIGDLIAYGFDPARAGDFYIDARPDYAEIGW